MDYKATARAYHTAVSAYDAATVTAMVREDYIQHNPRVPTGRDAFVAMLPTLAAHRSRIENVRMLSDGPYVVMHHRWVNAAPFGAETMAAFHIIRFDAQGLIAEHWSVMDARGRLDGEVEVRDIAATQANKATVQGLVDAWTRGERRNEHRAVGERPVYERLHRVFGEGNFVLSIAEGAPTALYDLFRLEDGAIVDRWHIYQEMPTHGVANANGMFGFPAGDGRPSPSPEAS